MRTLRHHHRLGATVLWVTLSVAAACRETPVLFTAQDRPVGSASVRRLTFSAGDELSPTWGREGGVLVYSGDELPPFPSDRRLLFRIDVETGRADLFEAVDSDLLREAGVFLTAPVYDPDFRHVAIASIRRPPELFFARQVTSCGAPCEPGPELVRFELRVWPTDGSIPLSEAPALEHRVPGVRVEEIEPDGDFEVYVQRHPLHERWEAEHTRVFGPTWSPDGGRLAFTDGEGLHVWDWAAGQVQTLSSMLDLSFPAWSPTGEVILVTVTARGDSATTECQVMFGVFEVHFCTQHTTRYSSEAGSLWAIDAVTGVATYVTEGLDGAWSPDGSELVFRRDGVLWRFDRGAGTAESLAGTEGGREPAWSPDGSAIAFTRINPRGDSDLWVVHLGPPSGSSP